MSDGTSDRTATGSAVPAPRDGGEDGESREGSTGGPGPTTGDRGWQAGAGFRRADSGPIMTGDLVDGRRVLGFGHADGPASWTDGAGTDGIGTGGTGTGGTGVDGTGRSGVGVDDGDSGDRLLLDGDERAGGPPARSADPDRHPALERTGPPPYRQIDARNVHHADALAPGLVAAFEGLLYGPDAPGFLGALVDRLDADGHGVWLVGGVPRDLVAGAATGAARDLTAGGGAHDLDTTGTAPAGVFRTVADEVLALDGRSAELPRRFSPRSLVCSVLAVRRDRRALDYRGLGLTGMPYPATGTDLLQDARQRDLTVNTLLYDPVRRLVLDPLGWALADLGHGSEAAPPPLRIALPESPTRPDLCAELLLRAAKFLIRWEAQPGLDTAALRSWAAGLPADLAARLDGAPEGWSRLAELWEAWVPGGPTATQAKSLREYGPALSGLLDRLGVRERSDARDRSDEEGV